jgi:hypothetical protein
LPNVSGIDSFTFIANDGTADSAPATVTIVIERANHAPTVSDLNLQTPEETPLSIGLSGADPDGDALQFQIVNPPAHGQLSGAAPNLSYTPAPGFSGTDSFTYLATDGVAQSATATVTINVLHVNVPPALAPIADFSIRKNSPALSIPINVSDTDSLQISITASSSNPQAVPTSNLVVPGTNLLLTPAAGATGSATITLQASDGQATSQTQFQITVTNTPPVAQDDQITAFGTELRIPASTLTANDSDADGDPLTAIAVTSPSQNGATILLDQGNLVYTAAPGTPAEDTFTYTVQDTSGAVATAVVRVQLLETLKIETAGLEPGSLLLKITGVPNTSYEILSAPDAKSWSSILQGTSDQSGVVQLRVSTADSPFQFYRVKWSSSQTVF